MQKKTKNESEDKKKIQTYTIKWGIVEKEIENHYEVVRYHVFYNNYINVLKYLTPQKSFYSKMFNINNIREITFKTIIAILEIIIIADQINTCK